jgi:hypothetical protein
MIRSNSISPQQGLANFNPALTRGDTRSLHAPATGASARLEPGSADPRAGQLQSRYLSSSSATIGPAWALQGTGLGRLAELARSYYLGLGAQIFSAPQTSYLNASELQRREEVLAKLRVRIAQHSAGGAVTPQQTTDLTGLLGSIHAKHAVLREQPMRQAEPAGSSALGSEGVHRFFTRNNTAFGGRLAKSSGWQRPYQTQGPGSEDPYETKAKKKLDKQIQDAELAKRSQQPSADADAARPKADVPEPAPRQAQGEDVQPRPQPSGQAAAQSQDAESPQRSELQNDAKKKKSKPSSDDAPSKRSQQPTADTDPARPKAAEADSGSTQKSKTSRTNAGRGQGSVTGYGIGETTDSSETAVWKQGTYHQGENHQAFAETAALEARARTFKTELGVGAQAEANLFRASAGVTADKSLAKVGDAEIVGASGYAESHFSVGARATAEAGVGIGKDGLPALRVGADVYTGALQENRAGGELRLMGIGVGAQGSTTLMAGAQANAEATLGVTGAKVSAGAFAGASAGASGTANVAGVGVSGSAEAWAGVGARLDADVGYKEGKLNFEFGIGAALGVGGATSVGFTWDLNKTVADGKRFVDNAGKLIEAQAATTAKTLEGGAKEVGRAATTAAKQVEQGFKSVTKSAGNAVKSVASAAKSVGSAISKGLKGLFG